MSTRKHLIVFILTYALFGVSLALSENHGWTSWRRDSSAIRKRQREETSSGQADHIHLKPKGDIATQLRELEETLLGENVVDNSPNIMRINTKEARPVSTGRLPASSFGNELIQEVASRRIKDHPYETTTRIDELGQMQLMTREPIPSQTRVVLDRKNGFFGTHTKTFLGMLRRLSQYLGILRHDDAHQTRVPVKLATDVDHKHLEPKNTKMAAGALWKELVTSSIGKIKLPILHYEIIQHEDSSSNAGPDKTTSESETSSTRMNSGSDHSDQTYQQHAITSGPLSDSSTEITNKKVMYTGNSDEQFSEGPSLYENDEASIVESYFNEDENAQDITTVSYRDDYQESGSSTKLIQDDQITTGRQDSTPSYDSHKTEYISVTPESVTLDNAIGHQDSNPSDDSPQTEHMSDSLTEDDTMGHHDSSTSGHLSTVEQIGVGADIVTEVTIGYQNSNPSDNSENFEHTSAIPDSLTEDIMGHQDSSLFEDLPVIEQISANPDSVTIDNKMDHQDSNPSEDSPESEHISVTSDSVIADIMGQESSALVGSLKAEHLFVPPSGVFMGHITSTTLKTGTESPEPFWSSSFTIQVKACHIIVLGCSLVAVIVVFVIWKCVPLSCTNHSKTEPTNMNRNNPENYCIESDDNSAEIQELDDFMKKYRSTSAINDSLDLGLYLARTSAETSNAKATKPEKKRPLRLKMGIQSLLSQNNNAELTPTRQINVKPKVPSARPNVPYMGCKVIGKRHHQLPTTVVNILPSIVEEHTVIDMEPPIPTSSASK